MYLFTSRLFPDRYHARAGRLLARAWRNDLVWLAGCALTILLGLQLAGMVASWYFPPLNPPPRPAAGGIAMAGNELLYRACVREARVRSMPVKPYPQEREQVQFMHEGKQLLKRTEIFEADVGDMSVENGCEVRLHQHVRVEPAPSGSFAPGMRKTAGPAPEATDIPVGRETPACELRRDMSLQSHYMLLHLCTVERKAPELPAVAERGKKKTARPRRHRVT